MIEFFDVIIKYISGLYTLPWIFIGFIITWILSQFIDEGKINKIMRKIGLVLLYFFVPLLLFRIFLSFDFHENELAFTFVCLVVLSLMYVLAVFFARVMINKINLKNIKKSDFIKTVLTNQGRSSAFIGGAMLAIPEWRIIAAIYMSVGAIFLFAIIPYLLSYLNKKDIKKSDTKFKSYALPWYLKIYPWYLLIFAFSGIILHSAKGITIESFGTDYSTFFIFFTQLTIPSALYYVGASIHPHDLKLTELKKLFIIKNKSKDHWFWVRNIFFLTVFITPILTALFFIFFLVTNLIPKSWFAVVVINSILPITSTNMFLVPYGINKKVTALSITWTTIVCIPIVVLLITVFKLYLT
jgi:hypothetical protein